MRQSGILMPVSALPGPYGIGSFSKEAYKFVDWLQKSSQSLWQILPLGPTSYGDSPYQSFSTFAGNPYFIDLDTLIEEGLLTEELCRHTDFGENIQQIDYGKLYQNRFDILRIAYEHAKEQQLLDSFDYLVFLEAQKDWLDDYALYMSVKNYFQGKSWDCWDEDIRLRRPQAISYYYDLLKNDVCFYKFLQYEFFKQWNRLKKYANDKGIRIIGDIPIYVAYDSADVWSHPELFQLNETGLPAAVAGCPPDGFSATGQLWGNPLYRWSYHKSTGFSWWIKRIKSCFQLYDIMRIDHFRGFDEYYSIPYGEPTAQNGHWEKGPGIDLFMKIREVLGELPIIAEDLGFLTDSVKTLLKESGFPGMKVLQFAFDSREDSDYLPHNYEPNCVVYTGTHDNDTIQGWYHVLKESDKKMALNYIGNYYTPIQEIHWDYIRLAMRSVANTCIIPIQDYLGLGKEARINTPSTLGGNWTWRIDESAFSENLAEKIKTITLLCARS